MRIVGLISGGKDSLFNMLQCIAAGHEIVAVANIEPESKDEMDSYMFQSVGHEVISLISLCLGLPMFRGKTKGHAFCKNKVYDMTSKDEVEDLFELLSEVKSKKNVDGVSVGAIASDYQRTRVENVCSRLNLICFAYLWKRDQAELLEEMINAHIEAVVIKVACIGLNPSTHLGMNIRELKPHLLDLKEKFGVNVCGEGGEYETLTLNCPLYNRRIKILESEAINLSNDEFAPVGSLYVKKATLMTKSSETTNPFFLQLQNLRVIKSVTKNPFDYIQDCVEQSFENVIEVKSKVKLSPDLRFPFESDDEVDPDELPKSSPSKFIKNLSSSKSQLNLRSKMNDFQISLNDSGKCLVSSSTGWCFIGNVTGVNMTDAFLCLQKHLERNKYDFHDAVFVNLYVRDLSDFSKINKVYSEYMPHRLPPARVCVETDLPSEFNVLMSVLAHKIISKSQKLHSVFSNRDTLHVQSISHWAPANIGPYSQCIKIGRIYYLAGQIPLIPGTMEILKQPVTSQSRLTFRHVLRIMEAIDNSLNFSNVLQAICYVASESISSEVINLWYDITKANCCTVTSVVVSGLPKSAPFEWEVMACNSDNPEVLEKRLDLEDFVADMKRCVHKDLFASSLVCNFMFTKKKKNLKTFTPLGLNKALESCIHFLKADCQSASPLCTLKLFYKTSEPAVVSAVKNITDFSTDAKVIFTLIPVIFCENREVCLTVTGVCH